MRKKESIIRTPVKAKGIKEPELAPISERPAFDVKLAAQSFFTEFDIGVGEGIIEQLFARTKNKIDLVNLLIRTQEEFNESKRLDQEDAWEICLVNPKGEVRMRLNPEPELTRFVIESMLNEQVANLEQQDRLNRKALDATKDAMNNLPKKVKELFGIEGKKDF